MCSFCLCLKAKSLALQFVSSICHEQTNKYIFRILYFYYTSSYSHNEQRMRLSYLYKTHTHICTQFKFRNIYCLTFEVDFPFFNNAYIFIYYNVIFYVFSLLVLLLLVVGNCVTSEIYLIFGVYMVLSVRACHYSVCKCFKIISCLHVPFRMHNS